MHNAILCMPTQCKKTPASGALELQRNVLTVQLHSLFVDLTVEKMKHLRGIYKSNLFLLSKHAHAFCVCMHKRYTLTNATCVLVANMVISNFMESSDVTMDLALRTWQLSRTFDAPDRIGIYVCGV